MQSRSRDPVLGRVGESLLSCSRGEPDQIERSSAFVPKKIQGEINGAVFVLTGDLAEDNGTVAQLEVPPLVQGIPINPADIFCLDPV
ncbi:hypothetical protein ACFSKY_23585 [Azotobacter chroococcum]|uniref:Uncharacterized protein n=1 Tax=Azotobacter chroococcum TaxID=353 RepID=A0A4R1P8I2_9GAMM|nr:hypothetical protein [Azotobacter chroococcum]TBV94975.1 hypothetical protein E0E53_13590 [Azotobacter chroococcum]TCL21766.1 hypothetical protein EV691_1386 [Azotobacter chroococcum]